MATSSHVAMTFLPPNNGFRDRSLHAPRPPRVAFTPPRSFEIGRPISIPGRPPLALAERPTLDFPSSGDVQLVLRSIPLSERTPGFIGCGLNHCYRVALQTTLGRTPFGFLLRRVERPDVAIDVNRMGHRLGEMTHFQVTRVRFG